MRCCRQGGAPLGSSLGLARIAVNHEVLPPGRRTSLPQAHSHDEEFIFILTGKPDLWIDGRIYPLVPGNVVAFPAGTGIAHTVINNTEEDVRILVVGDADQSEDRCLYPLNPELKFVDDIPWWEDAPRRPLGPHAGRPNCRE